jgi:hypothetical protein
MRLGQRAITRAMVIDSIDSYEIIESRTEAPRLPSYLVRAESGVDIIHILFAADTTNRNVRIVTAYRPDPDDWREDFRTRR